jgi:hypothetical protein
MYDLQVSAQGTVELLAEAICPLCDAELKGDLSVSGIERVARIAMVVSGVRGGRSGAWWSSVVISSVLESS